MVHFTDFVADSVAVCGELYEQFAECKYYCGVSDWSGDFVDCGEFFEGCGGDSGKIKISTND